MRRFLLPLLLIGLPAVAAAQSQTSNVVGRPAGPNAEQVCGRDATGNCRVPRVNADGTLATATTGSGPQPSASSTSVTPASDSPAFPIGGVVAPITGGITAMTAGQRGMAMLDRYGAIRVQSTVIQATGTDSLPDGNFGYSASDYAADPSARSVPGVLNMFWSAADAAWRKTRGDGTGAWVHAPASTPTLLGGTVATSGGTVALTFTNTSDGEFANPSTATWWCSWGTPAVNGANSYPVLTNGSYRPPNRVAGTWTCLSTAANQPYTFTRF